MLSNLSQVKKKIKGKREMTTGTKKKRNVVKGRRRLVQKQEFELVTELHDNNVVDVDMDDSDMDNYQSELEMTEIERECENALVEDGVRIIVLLYIMNEIYFI